MAAVSIFDIFKIGIGPSSSHTVGPMMAACAFAGDLAAQHSKVGSVEVVLHGSLAWTGKGHGTDSAVILGLIGLQPETIDPDAVEGILAAVGSSGKLAIPGVGEIDFDPGQHIRFDFETELPRHTNGLHFVARSPSGNVIAEDNYYSLGGGFIARNDEPEPTGQEGDPQIDRPPRRSPREARERPRRVWRAIVGAQGQSELRSAHGG